MSTAPRQPGKSVRVLAPRRSRSRLLARLVLLLIVALLTARWAWCRHGQLRLERERAALRAAGEPTDLFDFREPPLPDDQNAAVDLIAAGELANAIANDTDAGCAFGRLEAALPLDAHEMDVIAATLDLSREALRRLDDAMAKPGIRWGTADHESFSGRLPWVEVTTHLPGLLRAAAMRSHQLGDDRDAMKHIRQLLFLARAINRDPSIISPNVTGRATDLLLQIIPDLRIGDGSSTRITPDEAQSLITDLMDDDAHRQSIIRALQFDRVFSTDLVTAYAEGRTELIICVLTTRDSPKESEFERGLRHWFMRPIALNDAPVILNHVTRVIAALRQSNSWPELLDRVPDPWRPDEVRANVDLHAIAALAMADYEHVLTRHFQILTERHLAATALAIRLYQADHDGRRPAALDDLVPDYLPRLPSDPFARGVRALGYRSDDTDPRVYSVGHDGRDDGGDSRQDKPHGRIPANWQIDWTARDAVAHLLRQPRTRSADAE
jgi:hypothetical protein